MPETYSELVNRVLRDHEGGDPSTFPIGDRSTARKPISKRDLREVILAGETAVDTAVEAAADAVEAAAQAVAASTDAQGASLFAGSIPALVANTTTSFPTGTIFLTREEGVALEVLPSATGAQYTTAGGVRLAETGHRYSTLARFQAAIARGLSIPNGQTILAAGVTYTADSTVTGGATPGFLRFFDAAYLRLTSSPFVAAEWLGMGVGRTGAQNAVALVASMQDGRKIMLPRGYMFCDPISYTVGTPMDILMEGSGAHGTVLHFATGSGIELNISGSADQMQGDKVSIDISGIGFRTEAPGTATALTVNQPNAGTGETGTHILRRISNCSFSGVNTASYWGNCINIINGSYWNIDEIWGRGLEGAQGGNFLYFQGGMSSVDNHISRVKIAHMSNGIYVDARSEGLHVRDCNLVHVSRGISYYPTIISGETDQPWLHVSGCHINATNTAIDVDNATQAQVVNNLIYLESASAIGMLFRRRGVAAGVGSHQLLGNQIISTIPASAQTGIQMDAYTGQSILSGNRFNSLHRGIVLLANCNQNVGGQNLATNMSGAGLTDLGTGNAVAVTSF